MFKLAFLRFLIEGFIVKFVASTDDMFSRLPVISATTETRMGTIAFAIGNLFAVAVVIVLASLVAPFIASLPHYRLFVAGVIFIMAVFVFTQKQEKNAADIGEKVLVRSYKQISLERFLGVMAVGFLASLVTLVDDVFIFLPLFDNGLMATVYASVGIFLATIIQLVALLLLVERIRAIPYQRFIVSGALVLYAGLVAGGVL